MKIKVVNPFNNPAIDNEIKEVKDTFTAYEKIADYDPYSIKSFFKAHSYITDSLIKSAGKFRDGDVGVLDGGNVVHLGARPQFVYGLVEEFLIGQVNLILTH